MRKFITLLILMTSFGIAFAQTQYRMFVHQGSTYVMESLTTDIQSMSVNDNGNIDIQTNSGTFSIHTAAFDSITFHHSEEGVLPGVFSVSESKTVRFSKGNLQYNAANLKWRFAEQQYHYEGDGNCYLGENYDGWIDLFGWGTSGWEGGGEFFKPWDNTPETAFARFFGPYGEYNLTGDFAHCDWGQYNCICNGGVLTDRWRTLLMEEWVYLYEGRANANNLRGQAKVCETNGYILLPDNWTAPAGINFSPNANNYSTNVYDENQWVAMEEAGAVFLPAAGGRASKVVDEVGTGGHYWSASFYNVNMAYSFYFDANMVMPAYFYSLRHLGFSVRPVIDF